MRRLIDSFGEYERLIIGARTRSALGAKRRRGERVSGIIPFGYHLAVDGKTLHVDVEEQRTLEAIRALRAGGASLRQVAHELNRQGLLTRAGTAWRFEYVRSLLRQMKKTAAAA